jgi:hypothetical protein
MAMARCELGYLCSVCGEEVEVITDSNLYLLYVLGEIKVDQLPTLADCHIRCNPALAQYIVDPAFPPVRCEGVFAKQTLDSEYVAAEEARVTRGWQRLQELPSSGLPILDYPLPQQRD